MSTFTFHEPGIFLAWGLDNGMNSGGDWTPESIADQIAAAGFKWAAQQFDSLDGRPNPTDDAFARFHKALYARGVLTMIWQDRPRSLDLLDGFKGSGWLPAGWILNVESDPFDYSSLLQQFRAEHSTLPAAVITNCDPCIDFKPFIAANVKLIPECYEQDNPVCTPANMVNRGHELGYRVVFPCVGVYDGEPLSAYQLAGDGWSVYLAEGMSPDDWATAQKLTAQVAAA